MPTYPGSDRTELHYDVLRPDGGDDGAVALVALAGGAGRHPSYLGDLGGVALPRRVIVPHLRGVGRSPLPDDVERASWWRQADDLEHLRRSLGVEQLLVLAHSAGTRLALSYAAQFPERVARMVLITPPAGQLVSVASDVDAIVERRRGEPAFDAAVEAWSIGPDDVSDTGFAAWLQQVAPLGYAGWGATDQAHATVGATSFAANRAYFSVDPPADFADRLARLTAPVLVVAGAQDAIAGAAQPVGLAALFPSGTSAVLEPCGHYPWVEAPTAFRDAVDGFVRA